MKLSYRNIYLKGVYGMRQKRLVTWTILFFILILMEFVFTKLSTVFKIGNFADSIFQAFVVCGIFVFDYFEGVEADRFYNHR
jgi:hypothetical protein